MDGLELASHLKKENRRQYRFEMKDLKALHSKVHPDPLEVKIIRDAWPEVMRPAVWVPYGSAQPMNQYFFLTVNYCSAFQSEFEKSVFLIVATLNEKALRFGDKARHLIYEEVHRTAQVSFWAMDFNPNLRIALNETYNTFFDYNTKATVKKQVYTEELERAEKIRKQNLELEEPGSNRNI